MEKNTNNKIGDFFMKKYLGIILLIIAIILIIPNEQKEIRLRVIANSNSVEDQNLKYQVVDLLLKEIEQLDQNNLEKEIKANLKKFDKLISNKINAKYTISFKNVYFPPKELKGEVIKGGKYKTLLVVIDSGMGRNWWSILNPEFKAVFEDEETSDVEFKFFFFEEIKKVLNSDN